ncbi:flagellar hook-associated protein FlgK [Marinobacterium sediminicola]|uniref:Flagellar hook-associated protein 1 n=1 Tax=Marinobacterium sediminicola TaxID=518898 RepID=A0ABY1RYM9_9GAMM|nr:flagellar hook-associated protein FlgK [Marinobacterium sediminicola]ULG68793.1 flagellar hook-associated protein FlgK [Marinobacterium sediminicola]SMR73323.1 flagellar hook-associated protein 1 FlgK [Marinobacterium sediminicola]
MSSSILNIGIQALNANQTALSYIGQNIANVNTEGYTRQTVQMGTQQPPILGVQVTDIQRMTDMFLVSQVWADNSVFSSNEAFSEKIAQLDQMLVSDATSLSASMDSYFAALQQVVDDPLFIANRELFLAEADSLANSFQDFDRKLRSQTDLINTEIRSVTDTVNSITQNIADLNVQISSIEASGKSSNELQDERDRLVKELSGYVTTNVISQDGITYNVMIGSGQPLVVGNSAARLEVRNSESDPTQIDIFMKNGSGVDAKVTDQLGAGAIGGLIRYRDQVLQPTINEVGRLAIVFSTTMNEQHRKGMDLNGDIGQDLFAPITEGEVTAHARNESQNTVARVNFYDVQALTGSDYEFERTSIDDFMLTRMSDGRRFSMADLTEVGSAAELDQSGVFYRDPVSGTLNVSLDGMTFQLKGDPAVGDSYLIQPTRSGGQLMDTALTNPKMLALASPLRIEPSTINTGNAEISLVNVTSAEDTSPLRNGTAQLPLEIVFNAPDEDGNITYNVYMNANSDNPVIYDGMENMPYSDGEPMAFTLDGYEITFDNQPNPGDRFTIEFNTDGYSDNTNALAMSDLQNQSLVNGYSYQDTYGQMLAKVGTQASNAQIAYTASQSVLISSENALQSVAGVNLDEEAAKLVQYQQAYSASAQLISAYQTIFDSLISAVRR